MAKIAIIDGQRFVSEKDLVEAMVMECIRYTSIEDLDVSEGESYTASSFHEALKRMDLKDTAKRFHDMYVRERFIARTLKV